MDEPVKLSGAGHRKFRHDKYRTPREAEKIFSEKVPEKYKLLINDAVLDHIILDKTKSLKIKETNNDGSSKFISIGVSINEEQLSWLEENNLNRSRVFQDSIEKLMKEQKIIGVESELHGILFRFEINKLEKKDTCNKCTKFRGHN